MNNNRSIVVYKEGIFTKIGKIIKRLFTANKNEKNINEELEQKTNEQDTIKNEQINKSFLEKVKIDDSEMINVVKKKEFFDEINGNAQALNMLSIDRLEKLEKYYDEIIRQNNEKIKRLKESA